MERVGESSQVTGGDVAGPIDPATVAASGSEPSQVGTAPTSEGDRLRAEVQRLTSENERYREHAARTSKLFLSLTNYAEWVREGARRDAELALRKARARVEQLEAKARALERGEHEHARLQDELAGLQAMVDETRARLSAFLAAGLQALNSERDAGQEDSDEPRLGDLPDTLHRQLTSSSGSGSGLRVEVERPER